ncbi:MAG: rod shape-determining protein MreC, partial [Burkholderiaceae bacterium]
QPFFHQGVSGRIRLFIAVFSALGLMQLDHQARLTEPLRQGLSVLLYPLEQAAILPRDLAVWGWETLQGIEALRTQVDALEQTQSEQAAASLLWSQLQAENQNLRALLNLKQANATQGVVAQFVSARRDPLAQQVVLNQGTDAGVQVGSPVISAAGVIGQVSRVYPLSAEVRLLSDDQLRVPVVLPRTSIRALTQGLGSQDGFEVQYVNLAAEIQIGDDVLSSGLDGLYPAGLPVGKVTAIIPGREGQFPRVLARPMATIGLQQQVLILTPAQAARP